MAGSSEYLAGTGIGLRDVNYKRNIDVVQQTAAAPRRAARPCPALGL
jgi:hypothetical protein